MYKLFRTLLILLLTLSCGKDDESPASSRSIEALESDNYFELMNNHRQSLGLTRLRFLGAIQVSAEEHSGAMAQGMRPFGHSGLSLRCSKLQTELRASACGEIVARGQVSAQEVLKSWLGSSSHRASIELADWTDTGMALAISSEGIYYWTQIFLRID
jgi:uncharacterized protein YkwD